ncbi:hypothetical protein BDW75DRAFT_193278 [Aspergillus navahoensis]
MASPGRGTKPVTATTVSQGIHKTGWVCKTLGMHAGDLLLTRFAALLSLSLSPVGWRISFQCRVRQISGISGRSSSPNITGQSYRLETRAMISQNAGKERRYLSDKGGHDDATPYCTPYSVLRPGIPGEAHRSTFQARFASPCFLSASVPHLLQYLQFQCKVPCPIWHHVTGHRPSGTDFASYVLGLRSVKRIFLILQATAKAGP